MIDPLAVRPPCSVMLAKPWARRCPRATTSTSRSGTGSAAWSSAGRLGGAAVAIRGGHRLRVPRGRRRRPGAGAGHRARRRVGGAQPRTRRLRHAAAAAAPRSEAGGNIDRLAAEWPASFIAFDLIGLPGRDVRPPPVHERRELLSSVSPPADFHLTPATTDTALARRWFAEVIGAGLDGLIAKPWTGPTSQACAPSARSSPCTPPMSWWPPGGRTSRRAPPDGLASGPWSWRLRRARAAAPCRVGVELLGQGPRRADRRAGAAGAARRTAPLIDAPAGVRADTPTAGSAAPTATWCCCAPSGWRRSSSTAWPTTASATSPGCCAGVPIARRSPAASISSRSRSRWPWTRCCAGRPRLHDH